ncbi:3-deoxy-manno-octulosonate cytidylyltransferase [Shewanella eurypsychrophilus]|uniref:8-amino-3,8-dideoxy-manno-octulosonate cytidylyltransferase n=1 Tax=Shewanella eurypsychrophilus TaxID=2593656 RepID=A0ABX6V9G9_9GAMM|nr:MULTISPECIES: 3-deoxy-manno-octulosonate cytidylyltransferase [Shewanella]QFU24096.1 3-deoxy-manno-octulosonate cytidylyltransferase [Shewanella sp. YLB-09]QPG59305.1 3-deoxy-manno-octulosonate cytidylyltransferase [Shewanella eurypsychrophilus]
MNYKIVIPARMDSTRLPGKPLKLIAGKPMIWHVYQRALETGVGRDNIIIATDNKTIFNIASEFGAQAVMTSVHHSSGTDRCTEVAEILAWNEKQIVVNLQGDEPLVPAQHIELVASTLFNSTLAGMATLGCPIKNQTELDDPNCVKLLSDHSDKAIIFTRSPMSSHSTAHKLDQQASNDEFTTPWKRHIGMYAYHVGTLKNLKLLPSTHIEQLERLEQLKALWHGIHIQVANIQQAPGHGVDTPEDLNRVRAVLEMAV